MECVHLYDVSTIIQLRQYMNVQTFSERRTFINERVQYSGFDRSQIKKGDRLLKFFLEMEPISKERLSELQEGYSEGRMRLSVPTLLNLRPVCQHAFLHITGLSKGFLYSHNKWLDGSEPTAQDLPLTHI